MPLEIAGALAQAELLNSWARSRHVPGLPSNLSRAVYCYKNHLLKALALVGQLQARMVWLQVKCRDCGGTGRYVHWSGHEFDHCSACGNTGQAMLYFVETVLPDGVVWHTPREKAPTILRDLVAGRPAEPAGEGWTVNLPGRGLEPSDLAHALNMVEEWLRETEWAGRWPWNDPAERQFWGPSAEDPYGAPWYYRLPIGARPRTCSFCDRPVPDDACSHVVETGLVTWVDFVCDSCADKIRHSHGPMPPFRLPEDLVRPAPIALWRSRRSVYTDLREAARHE